MKKPRGAPETTLTLKGPTHEGGEPPHWLLGSIPRCGHPLQCLLGNAFLWWSSGQVTSMHSESEKPCNEEICSLHFLCFSHILPCNAFRINNHQRDVANADSHCDLLVIESNVPCSLYPLKISREGEESRLSAGTGKTWVGRRDLEV